MWLKVNADKTEFLKMTRSGEGGAALRVGDLEFKGVTNFRYLGSQFTSDNNMSQEVTARLLCASRGLYVVRRLLVSQLLSQKTKLRIWNVVLHAMVLYGCESWSLTARDRSRLLVFENHVLRAILGPVWDPVTGQLRLRSNHNIRNLTGQPLITSVNRSRRLLWAGHMVRAPEERGIHKALYGRAMRRRPQGWPRMRWVDNVRQDATSLVVRDWQVSARDRG